MRSGQDIQRLGYKWFLEFILWYCKENLPHE